MNNYRSKKISIDQDAILKDSTPSLQNQIIAAVICNLGAFSSGAIIGWASPSLEHLKNTKFLTEADVTWSGGLFALGGLLSVPLFEYVADNKGRKPAAYLIGFPLTLGCILMAWGDSSYWLLLARFLCGLGSGASLSLPLLYIKETCEYRAHSLLLSLVMIESSLGILYSFILGTFLPDIDMLPITILPLPLIFLLMFWFMPETPLFRLRLREEEKAARALAWLRKLPLNSKEVKAELTQLAKKLNLKLPLPPLPIKRRTRITRKKPQPLYIRTLSQTDAIKESRLPLEKLKIEKKPRPNIVKPEKSILESLKQLIMSRAGRSGLSICLLLVLPQTFTGFLAITMNAAYIFKTADIPILPNICAILYAVIMVCGSIMGAFLTYKTGRRIVQIGTCMIVCLCHIFTGISLQSAANGDGKSFLTWLPLFALPLYIFVFSIGIVNMPFVMISEMFASENQNFVNTIVMIFMWITLFILLQFFPLCLYFIGLHNVFYIFAIVALASAIYAYFFLIETKGKSLEDIIRELSGEKVMKANDIYYTNVKMEPGPNKV